MRAPHFARSTAVFLTNYSNIAAPRYTILSGKSACTPPDLPPCCPQSQSSSPEASSDKADACMNRGVPRHDSCDFMDVDNHAPAPERIEDWSTDFGSFLDDIPASEFLDPWIMSKTTSLDDIFNTPPESVHAAHDLPFFTTNSSVADTCMKLVHEPFDAHGTQYLNSNQCESLDLHDYNSVSAQTSPAGIAHGLAVSNLNCTAKHAVMQADVMRRNDTESGSRVIITIDNAESDTIMGVMKVLVASKAKVNFQQSA